MKIKWRHRQHCKWSRQQHVLLYVIRWQMIRFQALWKTKSFVKVCLKSNLPLWTKGLLIHLSPLWQLPLWHFPQWHNFPVFPQYWKPNFNVNRFVLVLWRFFSFRNEWMYNSIASPCFWKPLDDDCWNCSRLRWVLVETDRVCRVWCNV